MHSDICAMRFTVVVAKGFFIERHTTRVVIGCFGRDDSGIKTGGDGQRFDDGSHFITILHEFISENRRTLLVLWKIWIKRWRKCHGIDFSIFRINDYPPREF